MKIFFKVFNMGMQKIKTPLGSIINPSNQYPANHRTVGDEDLRECVENKKGALVLISGTSGSGKTTALNALTGESGKESFFLYRSDGSLFGDSNASADLFLTGEDVSKVQTAEEFYKTLIDMQKVYQMIRTMINKNTDPIHGVYLRGEKSPTGEKVRDGRMIFNPTDSPILVGEGIGLEQILMNPTMVSQLQKEIKKLYGVIIADNPALAMLIRCKDKVDTQGAQFPNIIASYIHELIYQLLSLKDAVNISDTPIIWTTDSHKDAQRMEILQPEARQIADAFGEAQGKIAKTSSNSKYDRMQVIFYNAINEVLQGLSSEHV